jgi:Tol biopolymer transport system component
MVRRLISLTLLAIVAAWFIAGSSGVASRGRSDRIVFADRSTGAIWTMTAAGVDLRRLTPIRSGDRTPTWSPDKRRIAFVRRDHPERLSCGNKTALWTMDADGANPRRITSVAPCGVDGLTWAPDGRRLAWGGDDLRIYVVNLNDHRKRVLTQGWRPAWSPDGDVIAYGLNQAVWLLDVATERPRILHRPGAQPSWSPDGRTLLFYHGSKPGMPGSYWVIWDRATRRILPLRRIPGNGGGTVVWSPDGRRFAFWYQTRSLQRRWIVSVDRDGTNMRVLVPERLAARITEFDW